ncbi:MAG: Asp-tRNA(Asn)/Glu-tRNA(Gln) amidotransferase subunit GatA [Candidatus Omnitrophica bacterium]|nr:Asp-tRNA(Asn)/Glu-tRNA(Gln) amidotransferase subunit GatA [Candidatus Omnitrophota bacterium]
MPRTATTATELLNRYRSGALSPRDGVGHFLRRQEAVDGKVSAFLDTCREGIETQLKGLESMDKSVPLWGVPVAVKDNIVVRGRKTRCASKILEGFESPYDATVVRKLRQAGAILCGTTNMDEFAFGSSTENSAFQKTANPWDLTRVPGGSSGGSAAAVAAGEIPLALGSDTGGSIRQPASFCGVVGLKPTYGRVSRYGLVAFASSLDQIGPLALTVRDAALLLGVIAGWDPMDSTSADMPVPDYVKTLEGGVQGLRIGIPQEYFGEGLDAGVRENVELAIDTLRSLGAQCDPVSMPHTQYAISVYYIVATAEASSNLARFDGVQYGLRSSSENLLDMYCRTRDEGFGMEVKRRVLLGTYVLSSGYYDAYYLKALRVRSLIKRDFDEAFKRVDVLATPTSPTVSFRLGEKIQDPLTMYLSDIYTISTNLAGVPAISIPCAAGDPSLPVGLQLLAKPFDEATLFRVAHAYETKVGGPFLPDL